MAVIDADCHVIESDQTWAYFDESETRFRPLSLATPEGRRYMSIDGKLRAGGGGGFEQTNRTNQVMSGFSQTTLEARTMRDIEGRLRHMDELGIDIQVLYPTLYLQQITDRPEAEVALNRSYNRWLADIWNQADGRLRWVAVLPLLDMEESLRQLPWCIENGACGVHFRGFEADKMLTDPYFFPLYEQAQARNVPVCVHAGSANPQYRALVDTAGGNGFSRAKLPIVSAMHALLAHEIPARFPELRWGFIEASASWIPWVITDLQRRLEREDRPIDDTTLLRDNHMYVTCQTDDDLPYLMRWGEDSLVIGTDYGHADNSSEIEALRSLRTSGTLSPDLAHKILEDNPKALYGL